MKRYRLVLVRIHQRIVSQVELDDLAERAEKRRSRAGGAPTPP